MKFEGTVKSDFIKLVSVPEGKKSKFIDFAATDFASIKDKLIEYIQAVYPLDYQNFSETDLGVMLIELVSYMGAVMSFKADAIAHESFLRTAKKRDNVRKLLELIGVSLKGPISSAANAQITLDAGPASGDFPLVVSPAQRVVSINSSEDGASVTYTLYKTVNGSLESANSLGNINLQGSEADNSASSVFTNLALLEGTFIVTSGTFAGLESNKRIALTESPVIEGSVEVFVTGGDETVSGAYRRVENLFFASGTNDKIFQVVYNDNFNATLLFGDGITGVSPPNGASFVNSYRVGGGTRGNITKGLINKSLNTLSASGPPLTAVMENTTQGTGGLEAETVEHAKRYAPLTFRMQDRLVTPVDYSTFASTFISTTGSSAKGLAVARKAFSSANIIDVYVLQKASDFQLQKATIAFKNELLTAIGDKKMITDDVVLVDGLIRTLDLIVSLKIDKELLLKEEQIKQQVKDKVVNYFNIDNFDFGEGLKIQDLNRAIFEIDDVRFSSIENLDNDIVLEFNEVLQLNNLTITVDLI